MKTCLSMQRNMVGYAYDELPAEDTLSLGAHLEICPACQEELRSLREILSAADSLRPEIEEAMADIAWDEIPETILRTIEARGIRGSGHGSRFSIWERVFRPILRPVPVALILGILLGGGLVYLLMYSPAAPRMAVRDVMIPRGALDSMAIEVARRGTLDFLERSRFLLLDFVQTDPEEAGRFWQTETASRQTRDLLAQKKYINQQLDKYQMAKAKAICDQIEFLFLELAQISSELSSAELEKVRRLIQERQLFLKIKMVEQELESEV